MSHTRQTSPAIGRRLRIGPVVIGVLVIALAQMAPHALPDLWAMVLLGVTVMALIKWRISAIKLILAGAVVACCGAVSGDSLKPCQYAYTVLKFKAHGGQAPMHFSHDALLFLNGSRFKGC